MSIFIKCKVAFDNFTGSLSKSTSAILSRVNWLYVRLLFITAYVIPQFFTVSHFSIETPPLEWQSVLIIFIFGIVGLQVIIGFQAFNPMSAKVWLRPAWKHNPFNVKQPLQFFHFGGWLILADSLPGFLSVRESNVDNMFLAIQTSFGLGMLIGVRLSVLIYRKKFSIIN